MQKFKKSLWAIGQNKETTCRLQNEALRKLLLAAPMIHGNKTRGRKLYDFIGGRRFLHYYKHETTIRPIEIELESNIQKHFYQNTNPYLTNMKYSWNAWAIRQLINKPNPSGPSTHTDTKHYNWSDCIKTHWTNQKQLFYTNLPKGSNIATNVWTWIEAN